MEGLGFFIVAIGTWIAYCGYKGTDPAQLALQILQHPADAGSEIEQANLAAAQRLSGLQAGSTGTGIASGDTGAVVAFARSQIGKPYRLGGAGPDVWDCSGLTMVAYSKVGVKLTHSALAQSLRGTKISNKADLLAGDLLFPTGLGVAAIGDHVQIYTGAGTVVEAANPKVGVREIGIDHWFPGSKVTARRLIVTSGTGSDQRGKNENSSGTGSQGSQTTGRGASGNPGSGGTMRVGGKA